MNKSNNKAINFKISESKIIEGVYIIEPSISFDRRGNIWTSFLKEELETLLPEKLFFKHDKFSKSKNNVLRGIHGDEKSWKLVTCVYGSIQQVVVDCRKESDTYSKYESFGINEKNKISVLIPPRLGNAYFVNSDYAVYHYKLAYDGNYIDADKQFSYTWNDPLFNIKWPTKEPILSKRDAK
jgi:dTDP-4-dehydrorhamnose 3,5-epimerase